MPTSFIYFIQAGDNGPIKIGHAADPKARLLDLQVANYEHLVILGVLPIALPEAADVQKQKLLEKIEREIHDSVISSHIRGEWFRPTRDVLALVEKAQHVDDVAANRSSSLDALLGPRRTRRDRDRIRRMIRQQVARLVVTNAPALPPNEPNTQKQPPAVTRARTTNEPPLDPSIDHDHLAKLIEERERRKLTERRKHRASVLSSDS